MQLDAVVEILLNAPEIRNETRAALRALVKKDADDDADDAHFLAYELHGQQGRINAQEGARR